MSKWEGATGSGNRDESGRVTMGANENLGKIGERDEHWAQKRALSTARGAALRLSLGNPESTPYSYSDRH